LAAPTQHQPPPPPPPGLAPQTQQQQSHLPVPSAPTSPMHPKASPAPSVSTLNVGMASVSLAASPVQSPVNGHAASRALSPNAGPSQIQQQLSSPPPQQQIPSVQSVASQIQQSRQQQQIQMHQNGTERLGESSVQNAGLPMAPPPPTLPTSHTPNALSDLMTRFEEVRKNCKSSRLFQGARCEC
jgi:hypothetical protein